MKYYRLYNEKKMAWATCTRTYLFSVNEITHICLLFIWVMLQRNFYEKYFSLALKFHFFA